MFALAEIEEVLLSPHQKASRHCHKSAPRPRHVEPYFNIPGAYLGCGQHIWYNMIFTRWFGAAQTTKATVQKVVADSTIHTPMCYLPLYFGFENWVLGGQASTSASKTGASDHSTEEDGANNAPRDVSFTTEAAVAGLKKYFGPEGWKTCTTYWQMWPLFHAINFHFTPPPMRIACIAGFSYLWLIVLSFLTHQDLDAREDGDHAKKGGCAAEEEK